MDAQDRARQEAWERATDEDIRRALFIYPQDYDAEILEMIREVASARGISSPQPAELREIREERNGGTRTKPDLYLVACWQRLLVRLMGGLFVVFAALVIVIIISYAYSARRWSGSDSAIERAVETLLIIFVLVLLAGIVVATVCLRRALGKSALALLALMLLLGLGLILLSRLLGLFGVVPLFLATATSHRAAKTLREAGVRVGLLGVSSEVARRLRDGDWPPASPTNT